MRVGQGDMERMRRQVREVLHGERFQRGDERLGVGRGFDGKAVGFVFVAAREEIHGKGDDQFNRAV